MNDQPFGKSPRESHSTVSGLGAVSIGNRRGAFTLIELIVVIVILSVLAAPLLPALSTSRKRALSRSIDAASPGASAVEGPVLHASALEIAPPRPLATVKSFSGTVALKPALSVGTADPESIYTAQLKVQFQAFNPGAAGPCEVLLPLPRRSSPSPISTSRSLASRAPRWKFEATNSSGLGRCPPNLWP